MSTVKANTYQDASGGNTATINSMTPTADSLQGFRNRIINGDMRIDQRNAGASVTGAASSIFPVDRFAIECSQASKLTAQQNQSSVTPPSGFKNYLGFTSSAATSVAAGDFYQIYQNIEGFNSADLEFGTANAKTITLSFWVRSSLTGAFGGVIRNSAQNRSYPFSYTISVANTWEQKSITIAGDTSGTWVGATNGIGLRIFWSLGMGSTYTTTGGAWTAGIYGAPTGSTNWISTNGATFYITGVQLEVGSTATPFERRPYGTELMLCQRYYQHYVFASGGIPPCSGVWRSSTRFDANSVLPVVMRATPTIATTNVGNIQVYDGGSSRAATGISDNGTTSSAVGLNISVASGGTEGRGGYLQASGATAGYTLSIEL